MVNKMVVLVENYEVLLYELVFEFDENDLNCCLQYILLVIKKLKCVGIILVLDNFGSGFVLLSYLFVYFFDFIKIDYRFVKLLFCLQCNFKFIQLVMFIFEYFKFKVIVEGVDLILQLFVFIEIECNYV